MYRHGDVILVQVAEIPAGARRRPGATLARGEATGHSHRIADPSAATIYEAEDGSYLRITADSADLVHDEHHTITLTRGVYRFWKQREYTPRQIRTVVD